MFFGGELIMYNYNTLILDFLQYKRSLGYKYNSDEMIIKEIAKYLASNNIKEITKDVTENYARINKNINSNTLARNMSVFREFNKYLLINGIQCYQIPSKIYPQNHKNFIPHIFTYDEIKRIYLNLNYINNNPKYNYCQKLAYPLIIKLLYQTGMRIGEVMNITVENYKDIYFVLTDTKNGKIRKIMIPDTLKEEIKKFHNKFHKNVEKNNKFFNFSTNRIRVYFKTILKKSEILINDNGPRLHDLRHTYIVHVIENFRKKGKNIDEMLPILQAQVGHQSLEALSYYFHLNNDILHELQQISNNTVNYLIPIDGDKNE